jgi:hypothetical protein
MDDDDGVCGRVISRGVQRIGENREKREGTGYRKGSAAWSAEGRRSLTTNERTERAEEERWGHVSVL